jgi:S1-C subfamily serine protease
MPHRVGARRLPAVAGLAAAVLVVLLAVLVLRSNDSTPATSPHVTPLRVTSGGEIATGFTVGGNRIVTVAHILDGRATVAGTEARVIRVDRRADLALLAVPGRVAYAPGAGTAARAADATDSATPALATDSASAGARLRLLRLRDGHPSLLSVDVRRTIVAHVRTVGAPYAVTRPALELAARVAPGDSGAPLISDSGALAGVIFAASSRRDGTAYAVDASAVARLLARD